MINFKKLISAATLGILSVGMAIGASSFINVNETKEVQATNDVAYKVADFKYAKDRPSVNSYTDTTDFTTTQADNTKFTVTVKGGSTNSNDTGWDYVRFGGKNTTATSDKQLSTIEAKNIGASITKIGINIVEYKNGNLTGIEVYTKASAENTYSLANSIKISDKTVEVKYIDLSTKNITPLSSYKINFIYENSSKKKNGVFSVGSVTYYKANVDATLSSISATSNNPDVYEGDAIKGEHFSAKAHYSDGSLNDINPTFDTTKTYVSGENIVDLSYTENNITKTCQVIINAKPSRKATDIIVTGDLTGRKIVNGTKIDVSKLKYAVTFDNGTTEDVSSMFGNELIVKLYTPGTKTEIINASMGMTSVELIATFNGKINSKDVNVTSTQPVLLSGFEVIPVHMTLIWDNPTTAYSVGSLLDLGTAKLVFNNDRKPIDIDFLTDKNYKVFIADVEVDSTTYVLSMNDNGKTIKLYYKLDTFEDYSNIYTLEVTNEMIDSKTVEQLAGAYGWTDRQVIKEFKFGHVIITATKGTAEPAYYDDPNFRVYKGGELTITCEPGFVIKSATLTFSGGFDTFKNNTKLVAATGTNNISGKVESNTKITNFTVTYEPTADMEKLLNWTKTFMDVTGKECANTKVSSDTWTTLGETYAALTETAKTYFKNIAKLSNTDLAINELQEAAQRYDYIARIYGYEDFAARGIVGNNPMTTFVNNENIITLIVVISILSVSAIALLAIAKRKKATR